MYLTINMSQKLKPYYIDDVNKKILARAPRIHSQHEYLSPENKYRDEEYKIYLEKRQSFTEAAREYRNLNEAAWFTNKTKLDVFSDSLLKCEPECACNSSPRNADLDPPKETGSLLRKRTERLIHQVDFKEVDVCSLEAWFIRYLKLCKFIYVARRIILRNRLLRNLEKLRRLDKEAVIEYEKGHRKYDNISYAQIFQQFL